MDFVEIAEELLQECLLCRNLFIAHDKMLKTMVSRLEESYNRGFDDGQDSMRPVDTEETQQARQAKLDAIMAEVEAKLNAKQDSTNDIAQKVDEFVTANKPLPPIEQLDWPPDNMLVEDIELGDGAYEYDEEDEDGIDRIRDPYASDYEYNQEYMDELNKEDDDNSKETK